MKGRRWEVNAATVALEEPQGDCLSACLSVLCAYCLEVGCWSGWRVRKAGVAGS